MGCWRVFLLLKGSSIVCTYTFQESAYVNISFDNSFLHTTNTCTLFFSLFPPLLYMDNIKMPKRVLTMRESLSWLVYYRHARGQSLIKIYTLLMKIKSFNDKPTNEQITFFAVVLFLIEKKVECKSFTRRIIYFSKISLYRRKPFFFVS